MQCLFQYLTPVFLQQTVQLTLQPLNRRMNVFSSDSRPIAIHLQSSLLQQPDNRIGCILTIALDTDVFTVLVESVVMVVSVNVTAALVTAFDTHFEDRRL